MTKLQQLLLTLVLALFAWLGSVLSLPLFFGVDFIFSSIFVLLAGVLIGPASALFVAVIGFSHTLALWGHGYAWATFVLESMLVVMLYRHFKLNLVLATGIFWICLGLPLAAVLYPVLLGMSWDSVFFLMFKQPLNSILNASVAGVCIIAISLHEPLRNYFGLSRVKLPRLIFFAMLTPVLVAGGAITFFESLELRRSSFESVEAFLQRDVEQISSQLERGQVLDTSYIENAFNGRVSAVHVVHHETGEYRRLGKPLLSEQNVRDRPCQSSDILISDTVGSEMERWKNGVIFSISSPTPNYILAVEQPLRPSIVALERSRLRSFAILTLLILLTSLIAVLFSFLMTKALRTLSKASKLTLEYADSPNAPELPQSDIAEYHQISTAMSTMTQQIRRSFQREVEYKNALESQVASRTEELRAANALLENVFNSSTEIGMLVCNQHGRVELANVGAQRMFEMTQSELSACSNIFSKIQDADNTSLSNLLTNPDWAQHVSQDFGQLLYIETKHRQHLPIRLLIGQVSESAKPLHLLIFSDISKLLAAEQLKRDFVSTVSHELRTPLTAIIGVLSLFQSGTFGELSIKATKFIQIASENASKLNALINDLLDLESIAAGNLKLENEAIDVVAQLAKSVELATPNADARDITLSIESQIEDAVWVWADPQRLSQVATNLLSNGIKFARSKVNVVVTTHVCDEGDIVRVQVVDDGMGVPESFKPHIFSRFSQAESTDNRKKGGTGLGLAISKDIIEHMGGVIGYESSEGQGASFWFELPVHRYR